MKHLVLYRKYRPKFFSEIVGQEHVVQTLTNAIASNSIAHAYLFTGPRGTGKTTLGRLLAKALNCQNRKEGEAEPCNNCSSCLEINSGKAIDLIEIDAASNRGIDEIRELKENIGFSPVKSKYKVFIIDEAHQLTKEAANALLKTLEEPPSHVVFVLATTEAHKMIPTIVSRCQRFDFRRLKLEEVVKRLEKILNLEKIKFEEDALELIAASSGGSIRDAETLLDQAVSFSGKELKKEFVEKLLGVGDKSLVFDFLNYLSKKDTKRAVQFLEEIVLKGVDMQEFLKLLTAVLREILLLKIGYQPKSSFSLAISEEERNKIKKLGEKFSEVEIKNIIDKFIEVSQKIKYASIPQLPLEIAVIEICEENG
jgi:DNA polymerase-3 subunit gamma/tau